VQRLFVLAFFAVLLVRPPLLFGREAREQTRIDFLLNRIESSAEIKFIRNGSEHDGKAAAAHLREKLNYGGGRIATAEDFIKYCASESSLTHQKYKVRLADGTLLDAADYFRAELRKFDAGH
jgi:hypothetical protein